MNTDCRSTCYSIIRDDPAYIRAVVGSVEQCHVELRLDSCSLSAGEMRSLSEMPRKCRLLAACHIGRKNPQEAAALLMNAIEAGFEMVDIPIGMPDKESAELVAAAKRRKCTVIVSYHNFDTTPQRKDLRAIVFACYRKGGDIAKVVCRAENQAEERRLTGLYSFFPRTSRLIAFAMGEQWSGSREEAVRNGSPLNYVALTRRERSAEGQTTRYDCLPPRCRIALGSISAPLSKSYAQRVIIASALAGDRNYSSLFGRTVLADDIASAMDVAEQFRGKILFVGESGLLARMMIPLCRVLPQQADTSRTIIAGKGTLLGRDIAGQCCQLEQMGLRTEFIDASHLPCTVRGRLRSGLYTVSGAEGSQIITGLLYALPLCEGDSVLAVEEPTSIPYLMMTVEVLRNFGIGITVDGSAQRPVFRIPGGQHYRPCPQYRIERDWSGAAMMLAAGLLLGEATIRGMNLRSVQGDRAIMDILSRCGADIVVKGEPQDSEISIRRSILRPFDTDITDTPDLFPALVAVALGCSGRSRISGVERLRNKESDRVASFCSEIAKTGAGIFCRDGCVFVDGLRPGQTLCGAAVSSHGDHRLAMALTILSRMTSGRLDIDDTGCISKSFPGFYDFIIKGK